MGKRGPQPTPKRILELRGSWRAKERGDNPQPTPGAPPCPTWLDKEARKEWQRLVPELERMGLLTVVDGAALTCLCTAWAEYIWATKTLEAEGRVVTCGGKVVEKPDGTFEVLGAQLVPHPAVAMQRSAWKAVKDFAALFGLNPSARTGLHVPTAPPKGLSYFARRRGRDQDELEGLKLPNNGKD
jgi:P27 family predicted phage terminase small subunit